jgi:hypothetical protein
MMGLCLSTSALARIKFGDPAAVSVSVALAAVSGFVALAAESASDDAAGPSAVGGPADQLVATALRGLWRRRAQLAGHF